MQRLRFPFAVAATSLALVLGLVVVGGLLAGSVLASGPWFGGPGGRWGPPWAGHGFGSGFALPPELAGLRDVPADQRFAHFKGVQVSLTDKDGRPLTIEVVPGTATAVAVNSLTIAGNDGANRSFTLGDKTVVRGRSARGGDEATGPALATGDRVVVVTVNGSTTPTAVLVGVDHFGPGDKAGY